MFFEKFFMVCISEVLVNCLYFCENIDLKSRFNIVRNIGRRKSNIGSLCYFKIVKKKIII